MALADLSSEDKQTIIQHLEDLRKALLISVLAIIAAAMICYYYNEQLLAIVTLPLHNLNERLVVTGVTEAFFVKLKLSFLAGIVVAFPIVVWAIWRFIKPALYPHERKYIYYLFPITMLLFVGGVLFAYFGILRLILNFFIVIAGKNLDTMFKVDQYVSFVMAFTIPFGLVFELPVVAFFLTKMGIINYGMLAKNRKYALLVIFILAAALTPGPDPISQLFMAVPVYILYEVSAIVAKVFRPGKERQNKGRRFFANPQKKSETGSENDEQE